MIRFIAAVDSQLGIADDHGIPWQGLVPTDKDFYHRNILSGGVILMGYGLYKELKKPYDAGVNYVATGKQNVELSPGFAAVPDARKFQAEAKEDVWKVGGAQLYASTFDQADELYITQLDKTFNCTKFFPPFKDKFILSSESEPITENGITYTFQIWKRKP